MTDYVWRHLSADNHTWLCLNGQVSGYSKMSSPFIFCPRCRNEVVLIQAGDRRTCPICAEELEKSAAGKVAHQRRELSVWGLLVRFVLVLGALLMVAIAVLYVGCSGGF